MPTDLKSYRSGDPEAKQGRSDARLRQGLQGNAKSPQPVTSRLTGINSRTNQGNANGAAPRDRGNRS